MENKRKTTTSWQVKEKYNSKVYSKVIANLPKDLAAEFKNLCKEKNISQASVVKAAVEQFISDNK